VRQGSPAPQAVQLRGSIRSSTAIPQLHWRAPPCRRTDLTMAYSSTFPCPLRLRLCRFQTTDRNSNVCLNRFSAFSVIMIIQVFYGLNQFMNQGLRRRPSITRLSGKLCLDRDARVPPRVQYLSPSAPVTPHLAGAFFRAPHSLSSSPKALPEILPTAKPFLSKRCSGRQAHRASGTRLHRCGKKLVHLRPCRPNFRREGGAQTLCQRPQ